VTTLTNDDVTAIASSPNIKTVKNISPELSRRAQISTGGNNTNTQVIGVTAVYPEVHKVTVTSGNFISQGDVEG